VKARGKQMDYLLDLCFMLTDKLMVAQMVNKNQPLTELGCLALLFANFRHWTLLDDMVYGPKGGSYLLRMRRVHSTPPDCLSLCYSLESAPNYGQQPLWRTL
jgi:hypothetical protein